MARSISDIQSFQPVARTLMGPGPSDIYPAVLQALSRPTVGHLDPLFIAMMDEVKQLLQYAFQTENPFTLAISAPGSAGMEACFVNLVEPGEKVIVCRNGVFGDRMRENVERCGATAVMVDDAWGAPVSPEKVKQALKDHPDASTLAFVHAETSTGACSDAQTLARLAREHGCLTIVDAVTSLGGVPLKVDEWQLDAVYSGSQKCLSCVPGLSPVTFSSRAVAKMQARTHKVQSWFLDQAWCLVIGAGKVNAAITIPRRSIACMPCMSLYCGFIKKGLKTHGNVIKTCINTSKRGWMNSGSRLWLSRLIGCRSLMQSLFPMVWTMRPCASIYSIPITSKLVLD